MSEKLERAAVFIDVQNLYHSAKLQYNGKVSYKHLIDAIGRDREIAYTKAYAAHKDPKESRSFYKALESLGVELVNKRVVVKHERDSSMRVIPVHFDVEIATDAMSVGDDVNTVVLCTGNGNFSYLAKALIADGLKVEIWSFVESTAKELVAGGNGWRFVQIPTECMLGNTPEEIEAKVEAAKANG